MHNWRRFHPDIGQMLEDNRIPSYTTPERAVNAINALIMYSKILEEMRKRTSG
jgi:acyl-CoA synthetase (NDP forming)